ncbi:MAG TPA: HAMP domain-containing protein, partial [Thermoanaerobaculia bacterium]
MSGTETLSAGATSTGLPIRVGLKLPPPEPPKFSLALKIFLAAAALVLIAVGGAIAVSAYRARKVADAKIAEDLKKSGPAWESFQQTRYAALQRALGVVANNPGIIALMSTPDPATGLPDANTVRDTLTQEQASSAQADFFVALDPQGHGIARTDRPLPFSADMSRVPTVAGALEGAQTEGIWLSGGKLFHVVGAPVLEGGARVAGVIVAAFQINDDVARSLKTLTNAEAVFLVDEARLNEPPKLALAASTMQELSVSVLEAVRRQTALATAVFRDGKTVGPLPLELQGDTYLAYLLPIRSSTDQIVGSAVALRSRAKELAPFRQIQNIQFLVGLLALAFAFLLSYLLARRITGPVGRLVRATEDVRVGNLESADLPVESKDEIGILARSFRAMLEELKEKAALEKYVASLTMNVGEDASTIVLTGGGVAGRPSPEGGPRSLEPRVGELFAGRYEIQSVLGKGGMGIVYRAHDRDLDDLVAIKTLRSDAVSADPSLLDRFKQEIKLARRITHPNILRTHDLGESNGL